MRDLILLAALIGIIPLIWRSPIVGVVAWIWVSIMSPQREVYGLLRNFELNLCIAAFTAFAWAASKERKIVPLNGMTILIVLFGLWTCLTTYLALDPAYSLGLWELTIKTLVLALVVITLVNTKARVQAVVWALAISLGYYGLKGGGFLLLTGGRSHVYGPDNTMIADNNALALALITLLPLLNYLRMSSSRALTRLICSGVMGFSLLAIVGTYSRGALLALAAAGAAFALRSRAGMAVLLVGGVMAVSLPSILPTTWFDRMATIQSYNEDTSFTGRLEAWQTAINIAEQRPLIGGGFSATNLDWVAEEFHSAGSADAGRAAHSIYFEVLGDHGVVGLALYLAIIGAAALNTFLVLQATRGRPDLKWANQLARMLQVSMVAYLVGGAALSMAYYDGFIVMLALTTALLAVVRQPAGELNTADPRWKTMTADALASPATSSLQQPAAAGQSGA